MSTKISIDIGQNDDFYRMFKSIASYHDKTIPEAIKEAMGLYMKKYSKKTIFSIDTKK